MVARRGHPDGDLEQHSLFVKWRYYCNRQWHIRNQQHCAGRCGTDAPPGTSINYAKNDIFGNAGGAYCVEWGKPGDQRVHSNDISVDLSLSTTFVHWQANGSGDYHEKAGSPTIDNGSSVSTPPTHDFDGHPRPQSVPMDIGAYEHN
jgi:hypothetical protein